MEINQGWECPRCHTVHSPYKDSCDCAGAAPVMPALPPLPYIPPDKNTYPFPGTTPKPTDPFAPYKITITSGGTSVIASKVQYPPVLFTQ